MSAAYPQPLRKPNRLTYTVPEAAEVLGISKASAYAAVRRREIPALRIGGRIVVPKAALAGLLAPSRWRKVAPPAREVAVAEGGGMDREVPGWTPAL